ncbi:TfpX/TfpZ family type IV pilin accessory protein [Kangiella sp. TOML190]|uniref:TfpX/TfpZ family type IV pilin accessory protein n=1 Tax=Kangiella sp. TOML190 TaxID=2931351 RepID=UPI0020422262|nr:TfpX/TfpZ family type IV pilin accessory protein [Kangiella sp. TOML190]
MTRVRAALTHFGISVIVFALFLSLVFFVWYAWPFNLTQGIAEIVYIMAGVDVVLGPLLTLIVFKSGKKSLKFDLSVIAAIQIAALVYGASVIYKERPAYIVFNVDRFSVVEISDINMQDSPIPEQVVGIFEKPRLIFAERASGDDAFEIMLNAAAGGKDIDRLPKFYRDYHTNKLEVIRGTKPAKSLPVDAGPIDMIEHIHYAPVVGKKRNIVALLDNRTGEVLEYRLVDPWGE